MAKRCNDFYLKLEKNPRYSAIFEPNPEFGRRRVTTMRPYLVPLIRTDRRANTPLMAAVIHINTLTDTREERLARMEEEEDAVFPQLEESDYV